MSSTETFQHYQVLKKPDGSLWELGRGAMGVTYKAFDTSLRCHVALKVINAAYLDSEMARQRFLREARAAAGLSHPNVASVFHLGEEGGNGFYAMEYINGETLESLVKRRGPLPPATALKFTLQVARALRAAAKLGLVHRDLKPANLMLVREDEEDTSDDELHVKVIDFGLAKVTRKDGADVSATITVAGFVGTPHFASPEQLEEKDLDARSDIYSLGVTLWYMLAGKPPFAGSIVQVMSQHLTRRPPFDHLPNLPAPAFKVLEKMLEKDPARRQQNPSELRREIEQAIFALGVTPPPGPDGSHPSDVVETDDKDESFSTPTQIGIDIDQAPSSGQLTARLPEPGVVLGGRYRLVRQVSQSEHGVLFQAMDFDSQRIVALKILPPELLSNAEAYQRARRDFSQAQTVPHPALLQLFALVRDGAHTFLTYQWINGFSVVDVLRRRPVLSLNEAVKVLKPIAAGADALRGVGVDSLDINSGKVLLSLENTEVAASQTGLLSNPLSEWPACQPMIFPLRFRPEAGSSATWAGLQTIVPVPVAAPSNAVQLALLAYELLGGNVANFASSGRYTPLPTVGERGNDILRDVLLDEHGAKGREATEFVDALIETIHPSSSAIETSFRPKAGMIPATGPVRSPATSVTETVSPPSVAPPLPHQSFPPPPPPPPTLVPVIPPVQPSGVPLTAILAGAFALLLLLGALAYFGLRTKIGGSGQNTAKDTTSTVTPSASETPADHSATPVAQFTPRVTPTPFSATPNPTQTPAQPTRASRLAEALAEARRLQDNRQTAEAFAAYLHIADQFPESDEGLTRVESYVSELRTTPLAGDLEQRRFQQLRPSMEHAANLGSDLAMLFLGDHLLTTEPESAANWYRKAAEKGRPEAMVALGDMSFRSAVPGYDPSQSASWYEKASDKGSVIAKLNLAECYEVGKGGVQRDFDRSFQLLGEALGLEPNNPRALEKMAQAYEAGHGTVPNTQQAFALMKRASDEGDTNATLNLGVYYVKGLGTPQNERTAVSLFKTAADKNNPAAMFYYAQAMESGLPGVPANKAEAANYYRAAAERGFPPAKDYCTSHRIRFVPKN